MYNSKHQRQCQAGSPTAAATPAVLLAKPCYGTRIFTGFWGIHHVIGPLPSAWKKRGIFLLEENQSNICMCERELILHEKMRTHFALPWTNISEKDALFGNVTWGLHFLGGLQRYISARLIFIFLFYLMHLTHGEGRHDSSLLLCETNDGALWASKMGGRFLSCTWGG